MIATEFPTKYTFITIEEAGLDWSSQNIMTDYGYVDGYLRGYNFEFKHKDTGKISYGSARFIYGSIEKDLTEDLAVKFVGTPFSIEASNGYLPTGRVIFRGYFTSHWDPVERDEYIEDASHEIEALIGQCNLIPKENVDVELSLFDNMENPSMASSIHY